MTPAREGRHLVQIVIPAFNEEARLPRTLAQLRDYLGGERGLRPSELEVVVVDNGSTDATATVAAAMSTPDLPVRVISCPRRGKGAAVRAGVLVTDADQVGYLDADGATSLDALAEAQRLLALGADIAIGSRAVPGSVTMARHSWMREQGAAAFRFGAGRLVPGVRDSQCGFKLFRGDLARDLLAATRTDGFSFDVEVLGRARMRGAAIAEFPVTWVDVPGSTFSPTRHGAPAFAELAAISWRLRQARRLAPVVSLTTLRPEPAISDVALDA